ncbi:STYKc [Aspergillus sclerotialis]|uniref:EKC/KEOPS complex subunit BUD32 n=1 Tax=Aspergillus sclerotialis TaxID=2070753 RepID=A0A3A2ZBT3_9EURO|nr:STYKc [Aspergillus sclerotialis]
MEQTTPQDSFSQKVPLLRADYQRKRDNTNLVPPTGRSVVDLSVDVIDNVICYTYWYEDEDDTACVRLADIPNTLSGDILRLQQDLPLRKGSYEVTGDQLRILEHAPLPPDDDSEDVSAILSLLPVVEVNPNKHFVKKPKYNSEIQNLLKCQGGSCPGVPKSNNIVQLLGKSPQGDLVFEKFRPRYILAFVNTLAMYKRWILQLISGLGCLHSLGIIHRDLRIDNLVFSSDGSRLLICDLEARWGNRLAPEISRHPALEAGWTEKSDIHDIGNVIKGMIYGNAPITNQVEWHVPSPLAAIVDACMSDVPEERPRLDDLYAMVEKINVNDTNVAYFEED